MPTVVPLLNAAPWIGHPAFRNATLEPVFEISIRVLSPVKKPAMCWKANTGKPDYQEKLTVELEGNYTTPKCGPLVHRSGHCDLRTGRNQSLS